jgi:hypothetical protein
LSWLRVQHADVSGGDECMGKIVENLEGVRPPPLTANIQQTSITSEEAHLVLLFSGSNMGKF